MFDTVKDMLDTVKEWWGCPNSRIKMHDYQWSLGPDVPTTVENGLLVQKTTLGFADWWMYCTKCGRRVWDDE